MLEGMSAETGEILDIIVDCVDAERVASFWAELLGRPIRGRRGPYVWLERTGGGHGLGFQTVAEPKIGKNRMHVDVAVRDVAAGAARIQRLGGRRVEGYEAGGFLVMADPEGNEFCLIPVEPFSLDEQGRTDYLEGVTIGA